jgi:hypothetical protein
MHNSNQQLSILNTIKSQYITIVTVCTSAINMLATYLGAALNVNIRNSRAQELKRVCEWRDECIAAVTILKVSPVIHIF